MKNYCLNIAGYNIRFESSDSGFDFVPSERFRRFMVSETSPNFSLDRPPRPPKWGDAEFSGVERQPPLPPKGRTEESTVLTGVPHLTDKRSGDVFVEGQPPRPPQGGVEKRKEDLETNDLIIRVHAGTKVLPDNAERVFHAPFVEELNGIRIQHNPEFWSIWKYNSDLFIKIVYPDQSKEKKAVLKFSINSLQWDLWVECSEMQVDPFEYPLDGLILYYLTVKHKDIMIHASGINHEGKGYLFSGVSGKGKTTISELWDNSGAEVIHDDRLILRCTGDGYTIHNTPVYDNDEPRKVPLEKIFIIEHGTENSIIPLKGANAVSAVIANCIQHNWGPEIVYGLLDSVSDCCGKVSVARLLFKPDKNIIDYIIKNE